MKQYIKQVKNLIRHNSFLSASFLYIISSFLLTGISFITTPIFTRLMETADYGAVSNFMTWMQFFSIFVCLQVASGLLPAKVNRAPERFPSYMKSMILLASVSAVFQLSLLLIFRGVIARWISVDPHWIPLLCICVFGTSMVDLCGVYFVAMNNPKHKVIFSLIQSVLYIGAGLLFVYLSPDKGFGRILGSTVSYGCVSIFALLMFFSKPMGKKTELRGDIKYALLFGLPLIPHLLANIINGNSDRVFIIKMLGEDQAGIYSVAYSIGMVALILAQACTDAWNPWYFEKTKTGKTAEVQNYFRIYALTISMCFVGVMFLAPDVMRLMAPESYWSGIRCILYVALGIFLMFLYRFPLGYEQLSSNTKYVAPATILTACVNIGLNFMLIPSLGIDGAAIATTISYVFLWFSHEFVARRIVKGYNIKWRSYLIPVSVVVSGFIISHAVLHINILRYGILAVYCMGYLVLVKYLLKHKYTSEQGEE